VLKTGEKGGEKTQFWGRTAREKKGKTVFIAPGGPAEKKGMEDPCLSKKVGGGGEGEGVGPVFLFRFAEEKGEGGGRIGFYVLKERKKSTRLLGRRKRNPLVRRLFSLRTREGKKKKSEKSLRTFKSLSNGKEKGKGGGEGV